MRNAATAITGSLKSLIIAAVALALRVPALSDDRMVLGPRQFESDKSGAVLCIWAIYLSVQARTTDCGFARRPVDDAIDESVSAMDEFILANSSLHPSRTMLEGFKHEAAEGERSLALERGLRTYCEIGPTELLRSQSPDQIRATIKKLLAIPREPVMNPCL
jgi:hypothetical protein